MVLADLITNAGDFRQHLESHVRINQEFNLYTNGIDELHSYIARVEQCCGECSFIKEHLSDEIYEIPWYQFHLDVQSNGIIFQRNKNITPARPLLYKGNIVNKIEIRQPV